MLNLLWCYWAAQMGRRMLYFLEKDAPLWRETVGFGFFFFWSSAVFEGHPVLSKIFSVY